MPPLPGALLITEFSMPALPFGWSVLLIAIATFSILCIAFGGPQSMRSELYGCAIRFRRSRR
jgi:hypothetical protein